MNEKSVLAAPILTFFSRPFYRHIALNGKGLGFLYILVMVLLSWTVQAVIVFVLVKTIFNDINVLKVQQNLPTMTWKDGKLDIDKPCPYVVKDNSNMPIMVFDTTGGLKTLKDAAPAQFLLTRNGVITHSDEVESEKTWTSLQLANSQITPESVKQLLDKIPLFIAGFFWASLIVFVYCYHLCQALIVGAVGLIMDRNKMGYSTAVRLAAFSMTPGIILITILFVPLFPHSLYFYPLIALILNIGFLYLAFSSVPPRVAPNSEFPVSTEDSI